MTEHEEKYERLAQWLGVEALIKLVPFSKEWVQAALSVGDEHLNGLQLSAWDKQHGCPPKGSQQYEDWRRGFNLFSKIPREPCPCCGQLRDKPDTTRQDEGVWGLLRGAIKRNRAAGVEPLTNSWSFSDTVCVLKHVAKFHLVKEGSA